MPNISFDPSIKNKAINIQTAQLQEEQSLKDFLNEKMNFLLKSKNSDVIKTMQILIESKMLMMQSHQDNQFLGDNYKLLGQKILKKGEDLLKNLQKMCEEMIKFETPLNLSTTNELTISSNVTLNESQPANPQQKKTVFQLVQQNYEEKNSKNLIEKNIRKKKDIDIALDTDINIKYKPYEVDPTDKDFSGYGIFQYYTHDKYEGEWVKGKRNGEGCFTTNDGVIYEGVWQMDNIVYGNIFNFIDLDYSLDKNNWYYSGQINKYNMKYGRRVNLPDQISLCKQYNYFKQGSAKSLVKQFLSQDNIEEYKNKVQ